MPFDPVPWFVEGGAQHSANVARLISYLATGGAEGVFSTGDLKVVALDVPGSGLRVLPGACVIRNRALGGTYESYVGRMMTQDTVQINPTTSSGPRTDLVIARVENPHISGEPWNMPTDVTQGPYIFPRVIEGVPSGTTSVSALNLGYSAITLAKVTIPSSTGAVTNAMVTDLRTVANTGTGGTQPPNDGGDGDDGDPVVTCPGSGDDGNNSQGEQASTTSYTQWPFAAAWTIKVPSWATHVDVDLSVNNVQVYTGGAQGSIRLLAGGTQILEKTFAVAAPSSSYIRQNIPVVQANVAVPTNLRGTNQVFKVETKVTGGDILTKVLATLSTQTVLKLKFKQKAT